MDIRIEPQADHIRVIAKGSFEPAAAREGIAQLVAKSRELGMERILVDGRGITTPVSVLDRYEIAKTLANEAQRRLRMAVVVTRENMFSKTLEDTARNLGMDVLTTESMAEALTYLGLPLSR